MSKSLKDIVEEGFGRLAALSEKRKDLIARAQELSGGGESRQGQLTVQKLEFAESNYKDEISAHVSHSQDVFKQTLNQIVEDNERFLAGVKENLQIRVSRLIKESGHTKDWVSSASSEKFDSLIRPLEREMEAGATELKFEAVKLLGELEAACKHGESQLHEAQAETSGKLSTNQQELTGSLGSSFRSIIEESELRRQNVTKSLEKLYSEQSSQMDKLTEELDERISTVVNDNIGSVRNMGKSAEKDLEQVKEKILSSTTTQIIALSKDSLAELETSYEFSNQELSEKLSELQTSTDELLVQVKSFLVELENSVKNGCEQICAQIKEKPAVAADKSPTSAIIDDAFKQLSREMDLILSDLKRQLGDLLKIQSDRLSNLCSTTENSISATASSVAAELKQMTRLYDQTWSEREQDIISRLRKLEKEAQDASSRVSGASAVDTESGSV
jgi:hypothetical protein